MSEGLNPACPFFAPSITSCESWHCARFVCSFVCSYIVRGCIYVFGGGEVRLGDTMLFKAQIEASVGHGRRAGG